jgi:hypothetical protein
MDRDAPFEARTNLPASLVEHLDGECSTYFFKVCERIHIVYLEHGSLSLYI